VGMTKPKPKRQAMKSELVKFSFQLLEKLQQRGAKDGFVKLVFDKKYGELLGGTHDRSQCDVE